MNSSSLYDVNSGRFSIYTDDISLFLAPDKEGGRKNQYIFL